MLKFATYLGSTLGLLALALWAYVQCTPHREWALIRAGNLAAALSIAVGLLNAACLTY